MTSLFNMIDANRDNLSNSSGSILQGKMHTVLMVVCGAGEEGLTTREIAELSDMSVYAARNWLLKLEEEGHIYKSSRPRNTTWHVILR
ncbi:FaeA/PapI family transcriptional regulator [Klebsiella pneumoniae]|uniref:FaeA/PapI family transcriptional regulator n=1 Tax=Klebsiella pneumoniae TaxID=573 RepID=UPI0039B3DDDC